MKYQGSGCNCTRCQEVIRKILNVRNKGMNKYQQKAEIWETQVWIMWLLALGLYETQHYILFGVVLLWSIISFMGAIAFAFRGKKEEITN